MQLGCGGVNNFPENETPRSFSQARDDASIAADLRAVTLIQAEVGRSPANQAQLHARV